MMRRHLTSWFTEKALTIPCPTCKRLAGQRCVVMRGARAGQETKNSHARRLAEIVRASLDKHA